MEKLFFSITGIEGNVIMEESLSFCIDTFYELQQLSDIKMIDVKIFALVIRSTYR